MAREGRSRKGEGKAPPIKYGGDEEPPLTTNSKVPTQINHCVGQIPNHKMTTITDRGIKAV